MVPPEQLAGFFLQDGPSGTLLGDNPRKSGKFTEWQSVAAALVTSEAHGLPRSAAKIPVAAGRPQATIGAEQEAS